jgi:hypothetical protein
MRCSKTRAERDAGRTAGGRSTVLCSNAGVFACEATFEGAAGSGAACREIVQQAWYRETRRRLHMAACECAPHKE